MHKIFQHIILGFVLLAGCGNAVAQQISFTATVDRNSIAVGEYLKLTITLSNSQQGYGAPDLGGLSVLRGPSESQQITTINGQMSFALSRTWVLTGKTPGNYTIGAAQVKIGGGIMSTDPIQIEVTKASSTGPDATRSQAQSKDKYIFASISLNKSKAFVGEQVVATYSLYSHYANLNLNKLEYSKMTGFWSEDIDTGKLDWERDLQTINGIQYKVAILKRQVLFPQKSGKLRIEPMELGCVVDRSFFNPGTEINFRSNTAELQVASLPSPTPSDFYGTVGDMEMVVNLDRTSVKANEAIQLNVKYSGRGNLKLLDAPKLDLPGDLEAYDPKVNDKISVTGTGMSGSREFEYIVIPRHEGEFDLEPITFSYFDPKSNDYKTLSSGPLHLSIAAGESGGTSSVQRQDRSDVTQLEKDSRYIRTGDPDLRLKGKWLFGSTFWFAGLGAPVLAFLIFLAWRRRHEAALADVEGTRRKQADRIARKHMAEAGKLVEQKDRAPFYAALSKALQGYMANKFGLGLAQLNQTLVREKLADLKNGNALADDYVRLITACDMARFAPVEDRSRKELFGDAVILIGKIEQDQKK